LESVRKYKDDPVYRHPYGGPLDIAETLNFIDVHFDNHQRRIDRILVKSNVTVPEKSFCRHAGLDPASRSI
jgi:hypothetical protein